MSDETKSQNESGLPDIAQLGGRKTAFVIGMGIIALTVVASTFFFTKSEKKEPKPVEETYTVQTDLQVEHKKIAVEQPASAAQSAPQVSPEVIRQQVALIQEKQKQLQQRLAAPLMLVNTNQSSTAENSTQQTQMGSRDPNMQFLNQASAQTRETATATTIGPLNSVVAEGSLIHAILESATNSDLPGFLRASVTAPVYSEDGTQVLIPRGSRLIGQYKSGMLQGQSRIFIVWTRLITPDGISVQLGSSGVDSLGVSGIGADEINRHFWERFGTASLLSLIGAGAANAGMNGDTQDNSASAYRVAVANSFAQSADESLQQESRMAPTLQTYQGKPIMVFVARDLNFQGAIKQTKPKMKVF